MNSLLPNNYPPLGSFPNTNPSDAIVSTSQRPLPLIDVIPGETLTVSARNAIKADCLTRGSARAAEKKLVNPDYSNLIIRQIEPTLDLNWGTNANQSWLTTALVSGTLNSFVNSFSVPVWQIIVIYGIIYPEASPSVNRINFFRGTAGQGGLLTSVNVAGNQAYLENVSYLSKAILYDPQDIVFIQGLPWKANANGEQIILMGYCFEPVGQNLATVPM